MKSLKIVHLYAKEMNIYGDNGNVQTLAWRLSERGIAHSVVKVNVGDKMPKDVDIIISGGGQDSCQSDIEKDLQSRAEELSKMSRDGVVMLVVCGMYQLFGHFFQSADGNKIQGISIFDIETIAGPTRHIGNVVVDSEWGRLVGFENHSGETFLAEGQKSLARVSKGIGNNEASKEEGAVVRSTFGTYMHGPLLPKNPVFADELLQRALVRKFGKYKLSKINDAFANKAADVAANRPR